MKLSRMFTSATTVSGVALGMEVCRAWLLSLSHRGRAGLIPAGPSQTVTQWWQDKKKGRISHCPNANSKENARHCEKSFVSISCISEHQPCAPAQTEQGDPLWGTNVLMPFALRAACPSAGRDASKSSGNTVFSQTQRCFNFHNNIVFFF